MITDFIPPEKLPHFIVWLDWNSFNHQGSFLVCFLICAGFEYLRPGTFSVGVTFFAGFCLWCSYLFFRYGSAVG